MTITEKAAYLRGLVEGQNLDPEAGEGKLWHVISEIVSDLAGEISQLHDRDEELADSLSDVELGLDYLEEFIQDENDGFESDEAEDDYYPFEGNHPQAAGQEEESQDLSDEDDDWDSEIFYEVECPNCGERIEFGDDALEQGSIPCPNCGATLEFELPDESGEEEPEDDSQPES